MGDRFPTVRLAAVQAASVFLDRERTVSKAVSLIAEAAAHGAAVIGFPEGFIPSFPNWYYFLPAYSKKVLDFSQRLFLEAVEVPGPTTEALGEAARKAGAYVVIGVNERRAGTMGTLYNSLLFFGPDGRLLGCHRKTMPTLTERIVHKAGDGGGLVTYPTPFGPIGGLICGENTNSLARMALLLQEERIHVASWPAFPIAGNTGARGIDIRVLYHAFEGRVFVISAAGILDDATLEAMELSPSEREIVVSHGGHSGIVGPDGRYLAGPVDDEETIVYADADLNRIVSGKYAYDLTGHYNRFDLFTLEVHPHPEEPLRRPSGRSVDEPAD